MLELYQFTHKPDLNHMSPFCLKLETYLKLAQIPYKNHFINNPGLAPKKKLPYVKDGTWVMGDSTLIIDELKKKNGDKVDAHLSDEQRSMAVAFQRLLEDNLVPVMMYWRWTDSEGWKAFRDASFGFMPGPIRAIVPPLLRRGVSKRLWLQGIARHTGEEVVAIAAKDFHALSQILGTKKFFFNEQISTLDIIAFSIIGNIAGDGPGRPLGKKLQEFPNLLDLVARVRQMIWTP